MSGNLTDDSSLLEVGWISFGGCLQALSVIGSDVTASRDVLGRMQTVDDCGGVGDRTVLIAWPDARNGATRFASKIDGSQLFPTPTSDRDQTVAQHRRYMRRISDLPVNMHGRTI